MRYAIPISIVVVMLLGGVVYRYIQVAPYPMGGGQSLDSPDGNYESWAGSLYYEDFWGYSRSYYEFKIIDKATHSTIRTVRMDHLPDQPPFPMRSDEKIISWYSDSSEVTFAFQGVKLTLEVKP